MPAEIMPPEKIISTNLYSGLRTTLLYERKPFAARVSWINWDSGFRDSGLRIEDFIVGVNGVPLALPAEQRERQVYTPRVIGQYGEYGGFALDPALGDGSEITVTVQRRVRPGRGYETLEIKGRLKAERVYHDANGRRALGPGGPDGMAQDGTGESWTGWYSKRLWDWERLVDNRWMQSVDNRSEFKRHQEHKERVELALKLYPGEFSKRLKEDFDMVARCMQGDLVPLAPDALAFREAAARRQGDVAAAGDKAWAAFLEKNKADTLASIPAMDLIRADRSGLTGKLVVLTGLSFRQAVADGSRSILIGQHSNHWCFVATDQAPLAKFYRVSARYKTRVQPRVPEAFDLAGRIKPQTRMVVSGRSGTVIGLDLEAAAVRVPGAFFSDLGEGPDAFAGEESIKLEEVAPPPPGASPSDVMRALVAALKAGNDAVWRSLYADWTCMGGDGPPYYRPFNPYNTWESDWARARNLILNKVCHVEPVWEGEPREVMSGKEFDGAPRIEECVVELNHVGRFEDGDRVFDNVEVHRVWTLQRKDGGPWLVSADSRRTL